MDGDAFLQIADVDPEQVPLVLIHDGGGTIFSYFKIGDIDRDVYGIWDPRFESSTPWEGGIPEIAAAYQLLIKKHVPAGKILLGGWSLGGLIAFEMARLLSGDRTHEIVGVVMIDTLNPQSNYKVLETSKQAWAQAVVTMNPKSRALVERSFTDAGKMIRSWTPSPLPSETQIEGDDSRAAQVTPSVYLLRAELDHRDRGHDWYPKMGWELCSYAHVQGVKGVAGRHFSLFEPENIEALTEALEAACNSLVG